MAQRFWISGLLLLTLAVLAYSETKTGDKATKTGDKATAAPHPGFEKMKKLAGTWVVADKDGKPTDQVASVIKVTAAGNFTTPEPRKTEAIIARTHTGIAPKKTRLE